MKPNTLLKVLVAVLGFSLGFGMMGLVEAMKQNDRS